MLMTYASFPTTGLLYNREWSVIHELGWIWGRAQHFLEINQEGIIKIGPFKQGDLEKIPLDFKFAEPYPCR